MRLSVILIFVLSFSVIGYSQKKVTSVKKSGVNKVSTQSSANATKKPTQTKFKDHEIFSVVERGDYERLEKLLAEDKSLVDIRNSKGYTPLHWLTIHYVDYFPELFDIEKARKNTQETEASRACLVRLVKNGANLYFLTPEGYNAIQFAVYKGKLDVFNYINDYVDDYKKMRDGKGNTLLHLLADAELGKQRHKFEQKMVENIICTETNLHTPNDDGQIPLIYFLSKPRCPNPNTCPLSNLKELLSLYEDLAATKIKDKFGMTAMDYAKKYNSWAVSHLENFIARATVSEQKQRELEERWRQQDIENERRKKEWQQRQSSEGGKCSNCDIGQTFTVVFADECYHRGPINNATVNRSGKGAETIAKFYHSRIELSIPSQGLSRTCYAKASRRHPNGVVEYILDEGCGYRWAAYNPSPELLMLESSVGTRTFFCN